AALAKAMEIGNPLILRKACTDKMQEPYRKHLIPQYEDVKKLCQQQDMITMFISGSGSTMIALTQEETDAKKLIEQIQMLYPTWDCR
ncbi:homoserine kinase, partial [Megasphaera massiliensis]|nr:homoserine kinase [Megasphaera massiliensis]